MNIFHCSFLVWLSISRRISYGEHNVRLSPHIFCRFSDVLLIYMRKKGKSRNKHSRHTKTRRRRWYARKGKHFHEKTEGKNLWKHIAHFSHTRTRCYALCCFVFLWRSTSAHIIHTVLCVSCRDWIIELLCCVISTANSCSESNWALVRHCTLHNTHSVCGIVELLIYAQSGRVRSGGISWCFCFVLPTFMCEKLCFKYHFSCSSGAACAANRTQIAVVGLLSIK